MLKRLISNKSKIRWINAVVANFNASLLHLSGETEENHGLWGEI